MKKNEIMLRDGKTYEMAEPTLEDLLLISENIDALAKPAPWMERIKAVGRCGPSFVRCISRKNPDVSSEYIYQHAGYAEFMNALNVFIYFLSEADATLNLSRLQPIGRHLA